MTLKRIGLILLAAVMIAAHMPAYVYADPDAALEERASEEEKITLVITADSAEINQTSDE